MKSKYVLGSDEFGMHLFPTSQWKWEKKGAEEVKSVLKEDKRQYTGDLVMNMDVKHISKNIDGEDRNLIKKGWDELYLVPIQKEGFLEQAKQTHKVAQEQRQKDKQQALFDAMKAWQSKNGSLDGFDSLKVDIISVHEQAARGVSQAESKFDEM